MAEMSDEEALRQLESSGQNNVTWSAIHAALRALREKVEKGRFENTKRKSLKELAQTCDAHASCQPLVGIHVDLLPLRRAADILRALDETVIPWIRGVVKGGFSDRWEFERMLRALGEDVA